MDVPEVRQRFLEFYARRGHVTIPAASLIPVDDASTLFTTAGVQPLVAYLEGRPHPAGDRLTNVQPCVRTDDIAEVGDPSHLTCMEMLGRWSLGGYDEVRAIELSYELLTSDEGFGIDPARLAVTVFAGDRDTPADDAVRAAWERLLGDPARVFGYGRDENWWGPVGPSGPCGPDSEMFFDTGSPHDVRFGPECHPACGCGRFLELGNDVFMRYRRDGGGRLTPLRRTNIDTGMGLERLAQVLSGLPSVYETSAFAESVSTIRGLIGVSDPPERSVRIVADHLRAATAIAAAGVEPSNTDRGYVLRRLVRRAIVHARLLGMEGPVVARLGAPGLTPEETRFTRTLERGLRRLETLLDRGEPLSGAAAFELHDAHGFPVDLTAEVVRDRGGRLDDGFRDEYDALMDEQRRRSRSATAVRFAGGLGDRSDAATAYHTVTHLTQAALRRTLGDHVAQRGSNITAERMRFDFSHPRKLTAQEVGEVEAYVNSALARDLVVSSETLPTDQALASGAIGEFGHRYPEHVSVYSIADPASGELVSREICGGPHVTRLSEIDGEFHITKQEAVGAGVRRLRGVLRQRGE